MSQLNDLKLSALETLTGLTGNGSDLELAWLITQSSSGIDQVNDLWLEFFLANGATSGHINDAAQEFMATLGFTNDLPQNWFDYWDGGGGGGADAVRDRSGALVRDRDGNIIYSRT